MYSLMLMAALSGSAATPAHGCFGCWGCGGCYGGCGGCYGGCYGGGCYGGGCWGGGYVRVSYGGCYGGCWGCCGGGCGGMVPMQPMKNGAKPNGTKPNGAKPDVKPGGGTPEGKDEAGNATARASLVVQLPADAKLLINDTATTSTSATRRFVTPPLAVGKEFFYTLTAEVTKDGKPMTTVKQVTVRAGETSEVTLDFATEITTIKEED